MKIKIDGKDIGIDLKDQNKNIVDIADDNGISIVAPCYRNNHKYGCCNACLILVDGDKKYACATKPYDGMEIIYKSKELSAERKVKRKIYADAIKSGKHNNSSCCSSEVSSDESCCEGETTCGCG